MADVGRATAPTGPWKVSDDTILSLATTRAIIRAGRVDPAEIASEFVHEFRKNGIPGLGASTLKALTDLKAGAHWALAGRKGERAAGNGAAMRVAPLAFFLDARDDDDRRTIRDVCRITHHNDEAYVGALAVLLAMQTPLDVLRPQETLSEIAAELPDTNVRDALCKLAELPVGFTAAAAASTVGTSGYVAESVPFAVAVACSAQDLSTAILDAVSCGGDTDTTASIIGQILGAHGHQTPQEWLARLPARDEIVSTAA